MKLDLSMPSPRGLFHFLLKRPVSCQKSQDPGKGGRSSEPRFAEEEHQVLRETEEKDFGRASCLEKGLQFLMHVPSGDFSSLFFAFHRAGTWQ